MKTCTGCKYADWRKTSNGRLHPSGIGRCAFLWTAPRLPAAFYFINGIPKPSGGMIDRKRELAEHCPYWNPDESRRTSGKAGEGSK